MSWTRRELCVAALAALVPGAAAGRAPRALPDAAAIAEQAVAGGALPGIAVLTMDRSRVSAAVAGVRRVGDPRALRIARGDRFAIGSMTKSMTATLAGLLVQQRRLHWNTRLYAALPEVAAVGREEYGEVTLLELLTHASGLYAAVTPEQIAALPSFPGTPLQQRLELVKWAAARAPVIPPRTTTQYSNGGYIAAGALLERRAARPYEALLRAELFAPLGLDARFEDPAARADLRQPWPHARDPETGAWFALDPRSAELAFPSFAHPAGGVSLRLADFARYARMHLGALRGERGWPICARTARALHTEVLELQGIGWVQTFDEALRPISFTAGSDELSFYGMLAIAPERDRAAIALTNGFDAQTEAELARILTALLD